MNEIDLEELRKNFDVIMLTPDKAREFLANQRENRKMKSANVSKLVSDMENGRFVYNGDPIRFDRHGRMGDGQHRCYACIKTGISIPVMIVRNLPDEAFPTIDLGVTRTAADLFKFHGIPNSTTVSSAVRFYLALCNDGAGINDDGEGHMRVQSDSAKTTFSNTKLLEEYKKNIQLWDAVGSMANSIDPRCLLTKSNIGGMSFYLIKEKHHPEEKVYTFFKQLVGKRDSQFNAINLMRDVLIDRKDHKDKKRYTGSYILGLLAKTWNAYVSGRELRLLKYNKEVEGKIDFL